MKHIVTAAIIVSIAVTFLTSCNRNTSPAKARCLAVRLKKNPGTLDPAHIVDLDSARIAAQLFNGLVRFNDDLNPVPDIAASWTISHDGLRYSFELKKGIRFFNGRQVTAKDVAFSFKRILNPATRSPRTWVLSRIRGAQEYMSSSAGTLSGMIVTGPRSFDILLEKPFAPFLSMLALTTAYIVPREEVDKWGPDYGYKASGTGPFVLEEWQHNQHVLLTKNIHYGRSGSGVSCVNYKIIPEDFSALAAFERGEIDILPEIMASEYNRFAYDPQRSPCITTSPPLNTYYLGLNCQQSPFNDVRVRKAMNYAIDRKTILRTILEERGIPATGPLPPALRGSNTCEGYAFNPVLARKLLHEAGYPEGFSTAIYQAADMENLDISQALQSYLADVGIRARIIQLEWSSFLETVAEGKAPAFWLSWWADYPDAENFLYPLFHSENWGSGGNRSRFHNIQIDAAITEAMTILDPDTRTAQYRAVEKTIVEEAPWVFCWHKSVYGIHQPWVSGYDAEPLAVMEKFETIQIKKPPGEGHPGGKRR